MGKSSYPQGNSVSEERLKLCENSASHVVALKRACKTKINKEQLVLWGHWEKSGIATFKYDQLCHRMSPSHLAISD